MKKSSTHATLVLMIVITTILLLALAGGVYFINYKNRKTSELLTTVESSSNNSILIQALKSVETDPQSEIARLNRIAISKNDLISFIENIEQTGKGMALSVKIVSVAVEENVANNLDKINIKIETSGGWRSTMQFNRAIENLPYRTIINSSSLKAGEILSSSATSSSGLRTIWKSNIDLALYSHK